VANANVMYSSLMTPVPPDWWSQSGTSEIGNKINLTAGAQLNQVTIEMDSQAVQPAEVPNPEQTYTIPGTTITVPTYQVPITLTIYAPSLTATGQAGAVLASEQGTFEMPYLPPTNTTQCAAGTFSQFGPAYPTNTSPAPAEWFDPATGDCYYGVTDFVVFPFAGANLTLPSTVIYGISYDNQTAGPAQSLNVLMSTESADGAVTIGSDTDPSNIFASVPTGDPNGVSNEISCTAIGQTFAEYNTSVNPTTGCGQTIYGSAPYLGIRMVPAVEFTSTPTD
jgi:hypothetical protein